MRHAHALAMLLFPAIAAGQSAARRDLAAHREHRPTPIQPQVDSALRQHRTLTDTVSPADPAPEPKLTLHAFADVRYSATDSTGSRNGFALGQFDLFFRSQLSEDLSVLSETVISPSTRNQFTIKLERLLLTWSPNDLVAVSVGRFHTGIGYYNAAYHHGTWFQTAVGRPLLFAFESDLGVVPVHTVGLSATGEIPSGALGLRYVAELGSGRAGQASPPVAPQPSLSDNNEPSVNIGLIIRPDAPDGLQVGVSLYRDRLTFDNAALVPMTETIGAGHAVYRRDDEELLFESVVMRHAGGGAPSTTTWGHYAQASHAYGKVRPYLRYDDVSVPRADVLFGNLGRRRGPTLGVRLDFDPLAALKLQASSIESDVRPTLRRFDAQVAFTFCGRRVTVLMRDPGTPEREAILDALYGMDEDEYSRSVLQGLFAGQTVEAPRTLSSANGVLRFVFNAPGAIGDVRLSDVDGSVRVLRVDGRGPEDAGYPLAVAVQ